MKVVICLFACMAVALTYPQAQQKHLIPYDAQIMNPQEGIEKVAYESIPDNQKIKLFEILGDQVPREVIQKLQTQVDSVGRS
jgi:hypothetical protein